MIDSSLQCFDENYNTLKIKKKHSNLIFYPFYLRYPPQPWVYKVKGGHFVPTTKEEERVE